MTSFNSNTPLSASADCPSDKSAPIAPVTVNCEDRWQVYHRLQELDISCQCGGFQPLQVEVRTVTEAIQLWSIVRRASSSRQNLLNALTQSWELPCEQPNR